MSSAGEKRRVIAVYRGRVQGVGFRYTVARLAGTCPVTGYVMNLSDGSVRLEAEGGRQVLEGLLDAIRASGPGPGIRDCDLRWAAADGRFQDFRIRYQTLE